MSTLLRLENLSVDHRLAPVTLQVARGECIGLIGRNGSGKTTLLRAVIGAVPTRGLCDLHAVPVALRPRHVAYMAQARDLVWPISVADCVALGLGRRTAEAPARVAAALRAVGLATFAARPVDRLSGGEKAAVLLARALVQDAPLLLADEPVAALDPAQAIRCLRLLRAKADAGGAVITSLHDLPSAAQFCTRLIVMEQGRILADGPPDVLFANGLVSDAFGIDLAPVAVGTGTRWIVTGRPDAA